MFVYKCLYIKVLIMCNILYIIVEILKIQKYKYNRKVFKYLKIKFNFKKFIRLIEI